jgi:hypothetical protein
MTSDIRPRMQVICMDDKDWASHNGISMGLKAGNIYTVGEEFPSNTLWIRIEGIRYWFKKERFRPAYLDTPDEFGELDDEDID